MAQQPFQDVISYVNASLSAREVVQWLGFRPEGLTQVGTKLKGYCPVHRGETFKSLQIDEQHRVCQCIVKDCPAYEQKSLVELVALTKRVPTVQAALDLASAFGIALTAADREAMTHHFGVQAEQYLSGGNLSEAIAAQRAALSANPDSQDFASRLASMLESAGAKSEAASIWLGLARRREMTNPRDSITLLENEVLRLMPDWDEARAEHARLLEKYSPDDRRWVAFRRDRARAHLAAGRGAEALHEMESLLGAIGEDPEFLGEYAKLLRDDGRSEAAVAMYDRAIKAAGRSKEFALAASLADQLIEMESSNEAIRERCAREWLRAGRRADFAREFQSLARLSFNRGDTDRSEELAYELTQELGDSMEALALMADIAERREDRDAQADHLLRMAELSADDQLEALLVRIRALSPQDVSQQDRLSVQLLRAGHRDEALELMTHAAGIFVILQEDADARRMLKKLASLDPRHEERRESLMGILLDNDQKRLAAEYTVEVARELAKLGDKEAAADLLEEGLNRCGPLEELEKPAVRILLDIGSRDRLLRVLQTAWDRLIRFDRYGDAEKMITDALEIFPGDAALLEKLADLMLMTDRHEEGRAVLMEISEAPDAPLELRIRAVEQAVELDLGDYDSLLFLSQLLEEKGDNERASVACQQAAELLMDEGSIAAALAAVGRASALTPDNAKLKGLAAEVALRGGDKERAGLLLAEMAQQIGTDEAWEEAIARLPESEVVHLARVDWLEAQQRRDDAADHLIRLVERWEIEGRGNEAAGLLRRAMDLAPGSYRVRIRNARGMIARGEVAEAVKVLLGTVQQAAEAGRREEELVALELLFEAGEPDVDSIRRLADLLEQDGRPLDALAALKSLLPATSDEDRLPLLERLFQLGESDPELRQEFAALLEMGNRYGEAAAQLAALAEAWERKAEPRKAVALLRRACELDRDNLDARVALLRLLLILSEWADAEELAAPLAGHLLGAGRHEDVRLLIGPLLKRRPAQAGLQYQMGAALEGLGSQESALECYNQAAALHESSGDLDSAAMAIDAVLRLNPENIALLEHQASLLRRANRADESRATYFRLLDLLVAQEKQGLLQPIVLEIEQVGSLDWEHQRRLASWLVEHDQGEMALELMARLVSRAEEARSYELALQGVEYLLAARPEDAELIGQRGEMLARLDRRDEAEEAFAEVARLVRQSGDWLLGIVVLEKGRDCFGTSEQLRRNLLEFYLSSGDNESAANTGLALIEKWHAQDRYEEAALLAEVLLVTMPERVDLALLRADLLFEDGRGQAATDGLREYVIAHQESRPDLAQKACSYIVDRFAESSEDLAMLSALVLRNEGVESARPLQQRALDLFHRQTFDNDDFKAMAGRLIAEDPGNIPLRARYIDHLAERGEREVAHTEALDLCEEMTAAGQHEEAVVFAQRALDVSPDLHTRERLAQALEAAGRLAEAAAMWLLVAVKFHERGETLENLRALRQTLRLDGNNHDARVALINTLLANPASALDGELLPHLVAAADRARELGENDAVVRFLEEANKASADDAQLIAAFATALDQVDRSEEATAQRLRLIELHLASGDLGEALRVAEVGLEAHPESQELRNQLRKVLLMQGDLSRYAEETVQAAIVLRASLDSVGAASTLCEGVRHLLDRDSPSVAAEVLEAFPELVEDFPDLGELEARALADRGDSKAAAQRWARLAVLHAEGENPAEAERCQRQAVRLRPDDEIYRGSLIALLRSLGSEHQTDLLTELQSLAELLERRGQGEAAIPLLREILTLVPGDLYALRGLRAHLKIAGQAEEALEVTQRLAESLMAIEDYEEAESAYRELAEDERTRGAALRALMHLYEATSNKPGHLAVSRELAAHFEGLQLLEDAKAIHERIAAHHADDLESRERLADYCMQAEDSNAAVRWLLEVGRVAISRGALERAADTLNQVEKRQPGNPRTSELLASLYEKLQDTAEAISHLMAAAARYEEASNDDGLHGALEHLLQLDPWHAPAHEKRAELFARRGDTAQAINEWELLVHYYQSAELPEQEARALGHLVTLSPQAHATRERYAMLLGELGRDSEAVEQLLTLAATRRESGERAAAIEFMETALTLSPDDPRCYGMLLDLYLDDDQADEANETAVWLADHHAFHSEWGEAIDVLKRAPSFDTDGQMQLRYSELLKELDEKDAAKSALERAIPLLGSHVAAKRQAMLALFALDPRRRDLYEELVTTAAEINNRKEVTELARLAIDSLLTDGEVELARDTFDATTSLLTNPIDLHAMAAELYLEHHIPELASAALTEQASLLIDHGRAQEALPVLARALALKPGDIPALTLKTDMMLAAGDVDLAIPDALVLIDLLGERDQIQPATELAEKLSGLRPTNIEVRHRLVRLMALRRDSAAQATQLREIARLYTEIGKDEEAANALRALLTIVPDDTKARARYIDVYSKVGDEKELVGDYLSLAAHHARNGAVAESIRLYKRVLELDPINHDVREDLVRLLQANNRRDEALTEACKLASVLVEERQGRRAVEVLQSLKIKDGVSAEYHETMGLAHLSTNSRGQAMREWRLAAAVHQSAGDSAATARVIEEMLAIDPFNLEIRQQLIESQLAAGLQEEAIIAMEELAERYIERGLCDLAEAEARRIIKLDQQCIEAWKLLFKAALALGDEKELVGDYVEYAEMQARRGDVQESIDYYLKAMTLDPKNLRAHRGYVTQYPKVGNPRDIVDEILAYAQLLVENGMVDDAVRYFELVMSIDPSNTFARDMLSATQSKGADESSSHGPPSDVFRIPTIDGDRGRIESSFDSRLTESQRNFIREKSLGASDYLAGTLDALDRQENEEALAQVVANYRTILAANAQNAQMRLKLADILEQMGRVPEMLQELYTASETLFNRGDLPACVAVCERYLSVQPNDGRVRKRLSEAVVKRDAMKALESAISYYDEDDSRASGGISRTDF